MFQIATLVVSPKWFAWGAPRPGRNVQRHGRRSKPAAGADFVAAAETPNDEPSGGWLDSSLDLQEGLHVIELFDDAASAAAFG